MIFIATLSIITPKQKHIHYHEIRKIHFSVFILWNNTEKLKRKKNTQQNLTGIMLRNHISQKKEHSLSFYLRTTAQLTYGGKKLEKLLSLLQ